MAKLDQAAVQHRLAGHFALAWTKRHDLEQAALAVARLAATADPQPRVKEALRLQQTAVGRGERDLVAEGKHVSAHANVALQHGFSPLGTFPRCVASYGREYFTRVQGG